MNAVLCARLETVTAALRQVRRNFVSTGTSAWQFAPANGAPCSVAATLEDNWLVLEARGGLTFLAEVSPWELLTRNAALPGLAKCTLGPEGHAHLRAELPLHEGADIVARIREACDSFEAACSLYEFPEPDFGLAAPAGQLDLKPLFADAGWPFIERGPDKVLVELETPPHFWQATVIALGQGLRLSCDLASCDSISRESRDAVAWFLLSASGVLRLVRAAIEAAVARLEVVFTAPPYSSEISSALESLSVGCSLCGEEVKTLQDPAIARRYLALRGRRSVALA